MTDPTVGKNAGEGGHVCGYVAIVGLPNAGKSTLMNRFMNEKVSIVTPKPQTTRKNVTTIFSSERCQIIFIDTPGILKSRYRMQEVMASYLTNAVKNADVVLVLIDAASFRGSLHPSLVSFAGTIRGKKAIVALNKIDIMKKRDLLPVIEETAACFDGSEIVPISAADGDGADELFELLLGLLPGGPKLYPDDIISEEPERFFVSELIRESVFLAMDKEIPYATAVMIEAFREKKDMTVIAATILVERASQKPILIGKRGAAIKSIGTRAREAIEEFLGRRVFLELHVKVQKDWRKKDHFLRDVGLLV